MEFSYTLLSLTRSVLSEGIKQIDKNRKIRDFFQNFSIFWFFGGCFPQKYPLCSHWSA